MDLEKDFEQGIVNSAIFLIAMSMQLTNFAINYHVSAHSSSLPSLPLPPPPSPPSPSLTCLLSSCVCWLLVYMQGKPFMVSLTDNKPLLFCLLGTAGVVLALASGIVTDFAASLEVVQFPEEVCDAHVCCW